ncbi:hypothetical protein [Streptomyces cinereospinus]|uniref:Uncharacterized protein n=1 Tax=Streptomyces cinereospinus TaxID=285561 RepID=A0ABV5MZV4_9ACTN
MALPGFSEPQPLEASLAQVIERFRLSGLFSGTPGGVAYGAQGLLRRLRKGVFDELDASRAYAVIVDDEMGTDADLMDIIELAPPYLARRLSASDAAVS